jgi:hypothetical protein
MRERRRSVRHPPKPSLLKDRRLILTIHYDGVVSGGSFVPERLRRMPIAKLHGGVTELRHQIEAIGDQPEVHRVKVIAAFQLALTCISLSMPAGSRSNMSNVIGARFMICA